jgi:hypothetical protein
MNFYQSYFKLMIVLGIASLVSLGVLLLFPNPSNPKEELNKEIGTSSKPNPLPDTLQTSDQNHLDSLDTNNDLHHEIMKLDEKAISNNSQIKKTASSSSRFLFEENFESEKAFAKAVKIQNSTQHGFQIIDTLSFVGTRSARFELRKGDPLTANGTRSEVIVVNTAQERERWYSFALYLPSHEYPFDYSNEVLSQWHQGGSPALSFRVQKDEFYLRLPATLPNKKWKNLSLGKAHKNQWIEFVFHVIHADGENGKIKVWRNGVEILTYQGPNNDDKKRLPVWKIGIYKAIWNNNRTSSTQRVAFFDNIKVGDSSLTWEQMSNWQEYQQLTGSAQKQ